MKRYILLSISGFVAFGFLIFLYQHSYSQLSDRHNDVLKLFLMAKQVEATLEKDLLKSRNFLLMTYDPIVDNEKEVELVCTDLHRSETSLYQLLNVTLDHAIDGYCSAIDEKMRKVERFKSLNAILRNSIYFVQKIAAEKSDVNILRSPTTLTATLKDQIINLSLAYALISTPEAKSKLEALLKRESTLGKSQQDSNEVAVAAMHASRILETKERLDELTKDIVNSNSSQLLEDIRKSYFQSYSKAESSANTYRQLLFGACTLFLLFILYNIILLWRAAKSLTDANANLEDKVRDRTRELEKSQETIIQQQQALISSAKMSSLGEMAGGVAHEINTPLAVISLRVDQLEECLADGSIKELDIAKILAAIRKTTDRIGKIVSGLRFFARDGKIAPAQIASLKNIIEDTLSFCNERFTLHGVQLEIKNSLPGDLSLECRAVEISQVILNLLNNSYDAISELKNKWIHIEIADRHPFWEICIVDSGHGIPKDVQDKMMQPFYTTKEIGKGTGLGLSISKGIIESHQGKMFYDSLRSNTCFTILLPKAQEPNSSPKEVA